MKKLFGYIFIVISILLALIIVGQLPQLLIDIMAFFKAITSQLNAYESGKSLGKFIYLAVHLGLTICLWIIGRKWMKTVDK